MISRDVREVPQSWSESKTSVYYNFSRISIPAKMASETVKEGLVFCSFLPLVFLLSTFFTILIKKCSFQAELDFKTDKDSCQLSCASAETPGGVSAYCRLSRLLRQGSLAESHFSREPQAMDVFILSHQICLLSLTKLSPGDQAFI